MATAPAEDRKQTESSLHAGDMLDGRYRVDYMVGRGGMAEVWAGTNERTGKRVALKMLLPSVAAAPGANALFHREGLAASRVNHPNVVTVFDVIQHEGAACIVMELLTGEALDVCLARAEQLPLNEAYGLLLPAMRGVAAAHAQGVIHRDLKPQNIFICVGPDGRPVTTKVLDFGISLIRAMDKMAGPSLPMGTPAYMAPEQIAGADTIDERADVYGFGVLFFEALSGELPFRGPAGGDLYRRIIYEPAPSLASLRPDLPPAVLRLVDVALAKDARDRHPGLDAMIGLLEAEMAFATPLPGVLGPITAGPVPLGADAALRPTPTPQAEASDERQSTRFLVNFPLERAPTQPAGASKTAAMTVPVRRLRGWPARVLTPAWRGMVAVGVAGLVVGVAYVVWLRGGQRAAPGPLPTLDLPPASALARPAEPVSPAPASPSTAVAVEPAAMSPAAMESTLRGAANPSLPGSEAAGATPSLASPGGQEVAQPARPTRSLPARTAHRAKADRRRSGAPAAAADNPADPFVSSALAPPPLKPEPRGARPLAVPKKAPPRAGALTTDDF